MGVELAAKQISENGKRRLLELLEAEEESIRRPASAGGRGATRPRTTSTASSRS
jgi:hypothetical protein